MRVLSAVLFLFLSICGASAGGRGGHVVKWDPNLNGGGWVCLQAQVTGCSQGFNATCNGTGSNDSPALAAWVAYAVAQYPTFVNLYMGPPGSRCNFLTNNALTWDGNLSTGPVNAVIWAQGVTIGPSTFIGGATYPEDLLHSARINSVSAGASSVVVNDGNVGFFSPGDWVSINGLSLQNFGAPPNFQFYEYHIITGIVGNTVTLGNGPLKNSYLQTWPLVPNAGGADLAGPATIYKMSPSWNSNCTLYGGIIPAGPNAININCRFANLYDVALGPVPNGFSPSSNEAMLFSFVSSANNSEIDKNISLLTFDHFNSSGSVNFTSPSPELLIVSNSRISGLTGTGKNVQVSNTVATTEIRIGPTGYGHGVSAAFDGVSVPLTTRGIGGNLLSVFTYSGGTFSIAKADPNLFIMYEYFVPNQKYFLASTNGNIGATFTVTAIREDASNVYADTDIGGALPTGSCIGTCTAIVGWGAATITQKFTGPADPTQCAGCAAP